MRGVGVGVGVGVRVRGVRQERFRKAAAESPGGAVCSDSCMWRRVGVGVGYGGMRYVSMEVCGMYVWSGGSMGV